MKNLEITEKKALEMFAEISWHTLVFYSEMRPIYRLDLWPSKVKIIDRANDNEVVSERDNLGMAEVIEIKYYLEKLFKDEYVYAEEDGDALMFPLTTEKAFDAAFKIKDVLKKKAKKEKFSGDLQEFAKTHCDLDLQAKRAWKLYLLIIRINKERIEDGYRPITDMAELKRKMIRQK